MSNISGISIKGYKSFGEQVDFDIRPLTLVFGTNSAGKSAALRAFPFISDSINSGPDGPLAFNRPDQKYGDFDNSISKFSKSAEMKFSIKWINDYISEYTFMIRNFPDLDQHIIVEFYVMLSNGQNIRAVWNAQMLYGKENYYSIEVGGQATNASIIFDGIIPTLVNTKFDKFVESCFSYLRGKLKDFGKSVNWLTALRRVPPKYEPLGRSNKPFISPDGDGILDVLNYHGINSSIFQEVSSWLKKVTGNELSIVKGAFRNDTLGSLVVIPCSSDSGPVIVNVRDTGEGISQVIPVITMGSLAKHGALGVSPLIVMEHPELHLHPAAHDDLADFFCNIVSSASRPRSIIETHSESFLLTIQIAILEGKIKSEDVIIHWVRNNGALGSSVSSFGFDSLGRPKGGAFPQGIFTEAAQQARKIVKIRNEKMKNENNDKE
ncbi:AAA family ATPase (plasmid) [Azospirillum melinis]|uniref:AAA family ATPase n=1 Tax=Azospirillum melinis TaxID=328839 RepID=UPI0037584E23